MAQGTAGANILSNTVDIGGATTSAFGTLETGELTPLVQLDFIYGVNTQTGVITVSGSGAAVDTNAGRLRVQSGTGAAGSAVFNSRQTAKYRPGQGVTARFTGVFATGTANNTQLIGVGTANDGYFFGYNGTAFGICRVSGGTPNWTAQTVWNGDKLDGSGGSSVTINPQFGNVYMIKYPFLGYGTIKFYVENPSQGTWMLVHTIAYPNTTASIQIANPNLNFYASNINSGNTSNLIMYCGSVGIFLSGVRSYVGSPRWATDITKASVTAETSLLFLKNATTYNTITNRSLIRLNQLTFSGTANGIAIVRLKLNPTTGGSASFTTVNGTSADQGVTITSGNSISSYDTGGLTYTSGGTFIFSAAVAQGGTTNIDLTPYDLFIAPTEILCFTGFATQSSTLGLSICWSEDI